MRTISHLITMNVLTVITMALVIMLTMMMIMMEFLIHKMHFHYDPTEQKDTDGDGIGDNSDTDYNSDGLPDDVLFPSQFFSPNGDGINDTWNVVNTDFFPNCEVWIYTRSGELIYNKKGYTNDWTGLLNGEPLPEASYVYMVDPDGDGNID